MKKQTKIPGEERIQRMIDCEFPLFIYIKKDDKWELVDYLNTIGPLAKRDMVIPFDLSDINTENIEIKLETGFMFWELDFVGIDFCEDQIYNVQILKPEKATGMFGTDWTSALSESDGVFMVQNKIGDITDVFYRADPPMEGNVHSVFLHTRGYYELIRDFSGPPEINELKKFRKPGYFSIFSRNEFLKTQGVKELSDLHLN